MLLHFVSLFASLLAIAFLTLCLASGLLYLAELIEENSQVAKKFGKQLVQAVILIHLAFYLTDGLPLPLIILGVVSHLIYLLNFNDKSWPSISLTSTSFISSCIIVVVDHFAWFFYFAERIQSSNRHHSHHYYRSQFNSSNNAFASFPWNRDRWSTDTDQLTFWDITTFFALCVWLVPFFLFLSLSASENVLPNPSGTVTSPMPTLSAQPPTPTKESQDLTYDSHELLHNPSTTIVLKPIQPPRQSFLKSILADVLGSLPKINRFNKSGRTSSRPNEGIISPSVPTSPSFASPLTMISHSTHSPPATPNLLHSNQFSPSSITTSPRRAFSSNHFDCMTSSSFRNSDYLLSPSSKLRTPPPPQSLPPINTSSATYRPQSPLFR